MFLVSDRVISEFNHVLNDAGQCVPVDGASLLASDESCPAGEEYWYERTPYRKIPYSSCDGGDRMDRGTAHRCPGIKGHGFFFWFFVLFVPLSLAALIGYWFYRRSGLARGYVTFLYLWIRLLIRKNVQNNPFTWCDNLRPAYSDTGIVATLASVPWFLVGLAGIAWERLSSSIP